MIDLAGKTAQRSFGELKEGTLEFSDVDGRPLVNVELVPPYATPAFTGPASAAFDCRREEQAANSSSAGREAWQRCFEAQSRWLAGWVRQARSARVITGPCRIDSVPVIAHLSDGDWWLWWLPLPHLGGTPYSFAGLTLRIDSAKCVAEGSGS